METALGQGCVKVEVVKRDGRMGIGLEQTCEPHEIGDFTGDKEGTEFIPSEKDVIIWIDNIKSGIVLQEALSNLLLMMATKE